jgi:hypothetical protein
MEQFKRENRTYTTYSEIQDNHLKAMWGINGKNLFNTKYLVHMSQGLHISAHLCEHTEFMCVTYNYFKICITSHVSSVGVALDDQGSRV